MTNQEKEIYSYIYDRTTEFVGTDKEELHNNMFNVDYYIIGIYQAKQWLGSETFDIINEIKEYENFNFGEVNTDLSDPEKVANMYAYIKGEEFLNEICNKLDIEMEGELTLKEAEQIRDEASM